MANTDDLEAGGREKTVIKLKLLDTPPFSRYNIWQNCFDLLWQTIDQNKQNNRGRGHRIDYYNRLNTKFRVKFNERESEIKSDLKSYLFE